MDLNKIRDHWEQAGKNLDPASSITPTSRDPFLGELERESIMEHLTRDAVGVEVGCGDGAHTVHFAKRLQTLHGVELAQSLVDLAKSRVRETEQTNVLLRQGSVLELDFLFERSSIDVVISQRCLINLPSWPNQMEALTKIHQILRPGGRLLLTEGFQDELDNLNEIRVAVGLTPIEVVSYNRNFRHSEFDPFVEDLFDVDFVSGYGEYLYLSRVFHPLAVAPEAPRHDSPLNGVAAELSRASGNEAFRRYSYNLLYVLSKRAE